MPPKARLEVLYAYNWHTTRRLLETAAQLPEAGYLDNPGYGHGSIHGLFYHLLATLYAWRTGLETGQQPPRLPAENYPDLQSLQIAFQREQQAWEAYVGGLSEADLEAEALLTSPRGQAASIPRWRVLHHLILHGMQHHAEIAQLLTLQGHSPGNLDFIFYG